MILRLLERLENSEEFKKFKEQFPEAYFCTAFFVIGKEEEKKQQLNYFISDTEIMSFDMGENITPLKHNTIKTEKNDEIRKEEIKVEEEAAIKAADGDSKKSYGKSIIVLQKLNGEVIWKSIAD